VPSDLEVVMTRIVDAPRGLVFQAWTDPEHVARWWGRAGSTNPVCEMDVRQGGAWRIVQREADGSEYPFKGVYREVVPPERLVFSFVLDAEPWSSRESVTTLALTDQDGGTLLTITTRFQTVEDRDAMIQAEMAVGAAEAFDRLDSYLRTLRTGG
jgi:uncharacterized protein YndB with AHSA1/START domain